MKNGQTNNTELYYRQGGRPRYHVFTLPMPLRSDVFHCGVMRGELAGWNGVRRELHGNGVRACSEFTELTAGCGGGLHASDSRCHGLFRLILSTSERALQAESRDGHQRR
jgi:hypothetical protein